MGVELGFISPGPMHLLKLERRHVGDVVWTSLEPGGLDDVMRQRGLHENHATQIMHVGGEFIRLEIYNYIMRF